MIAKVHYSQTLAVTFAVIDFGYGGPWPTPADPCADLTLRAVVTTHSMLQKITEMKSADHKGTDTRV